VESGSNGLDSCRGDIEATAKGSISSPSPSGNYSLRPTSGQGPRRPKSAHRDRIISTELRLFGYPSKFLIQC
jgi:hypothetical protein